MQVVMTASAQAFITPLSAATLSGQPVRQDLFSLTDEALIGHIELSRSADLIVVAPATANLLARMAGGLADDLATTLLLATDKRVLVAPAMNVRMWLHPATQRNIERLKADGVAFVGPDEGPMACGEFGPGRMAEPSAIVEAIDIALGRKTSDSAESAPLPLSGRSVIVTSGPTYEPIDPVRFHWQSVVRAPGARNRASCRWRRRKGDACHRTGFLARSAWGEGRSRRISARHAGRGCRGFARRRLHSRRRRGGLAS